MKAMILAAGLGRRMRPLTDARPKPLLEVAGKPLLQYHLEALAAAGVKEVIINLAYLGQQIRDFVGQGDAFGLTVNYSEEPEPLETGGAIVHARALLGQEPFLLVNGDVRTDYPLGGLVRRGLPETRDGHLVLVPNPAFHPGGDFSLDAGGRVCQRQPAQSYTYAGIALLRPGAVIAAAAGRHKFPLLDMFNAAMAQRRLGGELHKGLWSDVGTPERLAALQPE